MRFSDRLLAGESAGTTLTQGELEEARAFLYKPGISVLQDARLSLQAGQVHAMHDPTEGGLYAALWELAQACGHHLWIDPAKIPVPPLSRRICNALGVDPLGAIASGALLLAAPPDQAEAIQKSLISAGIPCTPIGEVLPQDNQLRLGAKPAVWQGYRDQLQPLTLPERDEIARLYD